MNPGVEQLTIATANLSVGDPSRSHCLIKRNQGDCQFTSIKGGSSKHACLAEDAEQEALTSFFQLPVILPSQVPNTLEEFADDMAVEDVTFVCLQLTISSLSRLVTQITNVKTSFPGGEKQWNKASEDATKACHKFEVD